MKFGRCACLRSVFEARIPTHAVGDYVDGELVADANPKPQDARLGKLDELAEEALREYHATQAELDSLDRGLRDAVSKKFATQEQVGAVFSKVPRLNSPGVPRGRVLVNALPLIETTACQVPGVNLVKPRKSALR